LRTNRRRANHQRYSSFIQFPIELNGKRLNTVQAIWPKQNEIKEEEYNEFYQYVGTTMKTALPAAFHSRRALAIQALLFVPAHNFERSGWTPGIGGQPLLSQVLIQGKPRAFRSGCVS